MGLIDSFRIGGTDYDARQGGILPADAGGTGNDSGYVRKGLASGQTAGDSATAEGSQTAPTGDYAHAEGYQTEAAGEGAHAEGLGTKASGAYQHVSGKFNVEDADGNYAEIVGNGTSSSRSNARMLDWEGNETLAGGLNLGRPLSAANGGTGQTSLQAARNAMGLGDTTGELPVANGGTGLSASPSMLTNLGSTSAANVLQTAPRPGVTGILPRGNGGTGNAAGYAQNGLKSVSRSGGAFVFTKENDTVLSVESRNVIIRPYTTSGTSGITIAGGSTYSSSINIAYSGYAPLGVVEFKNSFNTTDGDIVLAGCYISGSTLYFNLRNVSSTGKSIKPMFTVLYFQI